MIGLRMLSAIDQRLREIRPQYSNVLFGGVSVILFGDFCQLPPVLDLALYQLTTTHSPANIQFASRLYRSSFE